MGQGKVFPFVFMIFLCLPPIIAIETPRFLAFWPLIIGVFMGGWHAFSTRHLPSLPKTYLTFVLPIICLGFVSVLWSVSPSDSLEDIAKIAAILILGAGFISICKGVDIRNLAPYVVLFPVSVVVAALLICIELHFDMPLYRIVRDIPLHQQTNTAEMNRGIICIVILSFISLGFLKHLPCHQINRKKFLELVMFASIITMLLSSQSQSGQLAFILGLLFYASHPFRYRTIQYAAFAMIISALFLTPMICEFLYSLLVQGGQDIPWLKDAYAGNRVEIWQFVMNYALQSPLYGHGLEATKYVEHFDHMHIHHRANSVLHPHNFAVQIWMEFGVLGTILYSLLFILLLKIFLHMNHEVRRFVAPAVIQFMLVFAVSYGMWQSWWLGFLVFCIGVLLLLDRYIQISLPDE